MRPTILIFNINDKVRFGNMIRALLPLGVRIRKVDKKDYLQSLGYLAGIKEMEPVKEEYYGEELEDEMMLMIGLNGSFVDKVLLAFKKLKLPTISYKAILTETNKNWNATELFKELKEEHEKMHAR